MHDDLQIYLTNISGIYFYHRLHGSEHALFTDRTLNYSDRSQHFVTSETKEDTQNLTKGMEVTCICSC